MGICPITNEWTAKGQLPGNARRNAISFAINGKGYLGDGYNGGFYSSNLVAIADFYEYNPTTDLWRTRTFLPSGVGVAQAASFVIQGKGYVAFGASSGPMIPANYSKKLLEYNPANNTWIVKDGNIITGEPGFDNEAGTVDPAVFAIELMNDTEYGLTAAVFSTDENRAYQILDKMKTGTVYWNCCDRVSPNVPWSGRKNSGTGATLSFQGIRRSESISNTETEVGFPPLFLINYRSIRIS